MKKIVLLIVLALSLWANQATIAAHELRYINSYAEGLAKAKKEHKLMMLVVVRDGCHWCKKFENETLKDPAIKTKINDIVKVLIDRNDPMPEALRAHFFPVTHFVDPKIEKSVWDLAGFKEAVDFQEDIGAALVEYQASQK